MIKVQYWDVPRYRLFNACPWAFYERYVLKQPGRPSASLEKAKAIRLALRLIFNEMLKQNGEPLKSKDITRLIQEAYAQEITPELHLKSVGKDIRGMILDALAKIDLRTFEAVVPEKKLEMPLDNKGHVLHVYIDLFLVMDGDLLYLINYKTGSVQLAKNDIRLETNAAVARANGYDIPILGSIFQLKNSNLDPVMISQEQSDRAIQLHREAIEDVERRLKSWIVEDAFPATPGTECEYCSYSGECPKGNALGKIPLRAEELTPERAKRLAEWHRVASRSMELVTELLKEYSSLQDDGIFPLNGGYYGTKTDNSMGWRLGKVLELLKVRDVDDSVFKNISLSSSDLSSYLKSKKHIESGFEQTLKRIGEEKTRNYFGYYKGQPLEEPKEDVLPSNEEVA